jgi:hypothetical protein
MSERSANLVKRIDIHTTDGCDYNHYPLLYCERADVSRFSNEKDSFLPAQSI